MQRPCIQIRHARAKPSSNALSSRSIAKPNAYSAPAPAKYQPSKKPTQASGVFGSTLTSNVSAERHAILMHGRTQLGGQAQNDDEVTAKIVPNFRDIEKSEAIKAAILAERARKQKEEQEEAEEKAKVKARQRAVKERTVEAPRKSEGRLTRVKPTPKTDEDQPTTAEKDDGTSAIAPKGKTTVPTIRTRQERPTAEVAISRTPEEQNINLPSSAADISGRYDRTSLASLLSQAQGTVGPIPAAVQDVISSLLTVDRIGVSGAEMNFHPDKEFMVHWDDSPQRTYRRVTANEFMSNATPAIRHQFNVERKNLDNEIFTTLHDARSRLEVDIRGCIKRFVEQDQNARVQLRTKELELFGKFWHIDTYWKTAQDAAAEELKYELRAKTRGSYLDLKKIFASYSTGMFNLLSQLRQVLTICESLLDIKISRLMELKAKYEIALSSSSHTEAGETVKPEPHLLQELEESLASCTMLWKKTMFWTTHDYSILWQRASIGFDLHNVRSMLEWSRYKMVQFPECWAYRELLFLQLHFRSITQKSVEMHHESGTTVIVASRVSEAGKILLEVATLLRQRLDERTTEYLHMAGVQFPNSKNFVKVRKSLIRLHRTAKLVQMLNAEGRLLDQIMYLQLRTAPLHEQERAFVMHKFADYRRMATWLDHFLTIAYDSMQWRSRALRWTPAARNVAHLIGGDVDSSRALKSLNLDQDDLEENVYRRAVLEERMGNLETRASQLSNFIDRQLWNFQAAEKVFARKFPRFYSMGRVKAQCSTARSQSLSSKHRTRRILSSLVPIISSRGSKTLRASPTSERRGVTVKVKKSSNISRDPIANGSISEARDPQNKRQSSEDPEKAKAIDEIQATSNPRTKDGIPKAKDSRKRRQSSGSVRKAAEMKGTKTESPLHSKDSVTMGGCSEVRILGNSCTLDFTADSIDLPMIS